MSLMQHIDKVVKASGKPNIFKLLFSREGVEMFFQGNIGYAKLIKGPTAGKLVGTDYNGNQYYENEDLPYIRKRWVLYKDTFNYNASSVPPEWYGWLEGANDYHPGNYKFDQPKYGIKAVQTNTGTPECYGPKGMWKHGDKKRSWKKYEAWKPATTQQQ